MAPRANWKGFFVCLWSSGHFSTTWRPENEKSCLTDAQPADRYRHHGITEGRLWIRATKSLMRISSARYAVDSTHAHRR